MMNSISNLESDRLVGSHLIEDGGNLEEPQTAPSPSNNRERVLHALAILLTAMFLVPLVIYILIRHDATSRDTELFHKMRLLLLGLSALCLGSSLAAMSQRSPIPRLPYDVHMSTWFGHFMSKEGEWQHIPVVLCATYSFVFMYGAIASLVTGCPILCIPTYYLLGLVLFYLWHWAAHEWEGSQLHQIHMLHHQDRYPRHDFCGDNHPAVQQERADRGNRAATLLALMNPVGSTTTTWAHEGPLLLGIVGILLVARLVMGLSWGTCAFVLCGFLFMGTFGSAIHMSFHERGFELEPYAWYRELRSLHMIHHMHRKNFAMVNILLDLVFSSLMLSE